MCRNTIEFNQPKLKATFKATLHERLNTLKEMNNENG